MTDAVSVFFPWQSMALTEPKSHLAFDQTITRKYHHVPNSFLIRRSYNAVSALTSMSLISVKTIS
jgi:hypothetical protein